MNKKISLTLIIPLLFASLLFARGDEKQEMWIKAAAEKDLETRLQLFEEYKEKYGDKKDQNLRFLYYNLTQTSLLLKNFEKVIEYGEKTLTFENLEDNYKLDVSLWLANAYNLARKDYDKAYSYASMVTDLGKSLRKMAEGSERTAKLTEGIEKNYIAPSLRIQIRLLTAKGLNDSKARMDVIEKALEAYELDQSSSFPRHTVLKESVELARMNMIPEAIGAIEKVVDTGNPSFSEARLLAQLYYRKYSTTKNSEDKDKAIDFYEKAYDQDKKSDLAIKLGQLLSRKDIDKAIIYFADAYILSGEDKESTAFKYLQQLWFKEKAKDKTPEEQEAGFEEIKNAAKVRLGKN